MSYLLLIIQLVSGVVGGNVLGAAVKSLNLGPVGNSIAGLIGGGLGGHLLASLAQGGPPTGIDVATILESIGGGVAGGGFLTAASAFMKQMLARPT
ncbi:MAG TPA: hypothetical protein VGF31_01395 [Myxococcaceae bacterium]|jgi:uncharacterized membrane protein YeaQ/YmgE (transglycosylase-associated protein family)